MVFFNAVLQVAARAVARVEGGYSRHLMRITLSRQVLDSRVVLTEGPHQRFCSWVLSSEVFLPSWLHGAANTGLENKTWYYMTGEKGGMPG